MQTRNTYCICLLTSEYLASLQRFTNITSTSPQKQLKSFLAISALLGLSWVTGFFLLMNDTCKNVSQISTALRWIFIILNAPQVLYTVYTVYNVYCIVYTLYTVYIVLVFSCSLVVCMVGSLLFWSWFLTEIIRVIYFTIQEITFSCVRTVA